MAYTKGSAAELRTQVYIASRVGIIREPERQEMVKETFCGIVSYS